MKLFHVGSCTEFVLQGHRFERLGDVLEVRDQKSADEVVAGGGNFITEEEFAQCGFTDLELRKYPYHGQRTRAPREFLDKFEQAREFFRVRCNALREPVVEAPPAEEAPINQEEGQ